VTQGGGAGAPPPGALPGSGSGARPPGGSGPAGVRCSDQEREATVSLLCEACAEGRLTLEELGDRVDRAYTATVRPELDGLVADLPGPSAVVPAPSPVPAAATRWWVSPIGGYRRRGHFRLPGHQVVVTLLGGTAIDLRGAELSGPTATITVVSVLGGADVVVPAGIPVDVSGFSVLGGRDVRLGGRCAPGAPTVHLRLFSVLGGSRVRTKGTRLRLGRGARRSRY
jgi:Domain of unknown function (DUF1707)